MIEIQCTSCHTRYRIDERVLPADSPTFKCSRCGHVFTTDPVTAKKAAPERSSKPATPQASIPRPDTRTDPIATEISQPSVPAETSEPVASEPLTADTNAPSAFEAKPAPIKPYIRNQRPTIFDRSPKPPPEKPATEDGSEVDSAAVARMRSSVAAPESSTPAPPPLHTPEPPPAAPLPPRVSQPAEAKDAGGNLEFDFNDENEPGFEAESPDDDMPIAPERWSVGDDSIDNPPPRSSGFGSEELDPEFSRGEPAPIGRGTIPQYAGSQRAPQHSPLPDEQAYMERADLHSARSFIGLFLAVAVMFLALTGVIHGIPSASAELVRRMPIIGPEFVQSATLENLVSVGDVQSSYQTIKGGHAALVLTGVVTNNSPAPLHTVQVGVRLLDATQREVASSAVYCGTTLSPRMIGEMTPHELEFLQKLDPQKMFVLEPGHAAPFLMVFIDPPRTTNHVAVAIAKAQPAAASGPQASAH